MKEDDFDRAVARANRAFSKLVRIRDGIEQISGDDALGVTRWRPGRANSIQGQNGNTQDRNIPFHRPVTRSYRLTNAAGATAFHMQHRAISKVTHEMNEGGLRNRPGAARAHSRYVERDVAVALIETELGLRGGGRQRRACRQIVSLAPATQRINTTSIPIINQENDYEYEWHRHLGFDLGTARRLVDELADLSPVLRDLWHTEPSKMPKPMPVCGCCPGAIWYVKEGDPMVTCPALKIYPWYPGRPFTDCQMRRRFFEARTKAERQEE